MGNRLISQEEDESGEKEEEGKAERGRRMRGLTLLALTDEDGRTKFLYESLEKNLPSVGFDETTTTKSV